MAGASGFVGTRLGTALARFRRVPPGPAESDAVRRRRRRVVGAVSVAGVSLLGTSLSRKPGSAEFYGLTFAAAATWIAGGVVSGPLHLGLSGSDPDNRHRPVVGPVLLGAGAFAAFYGCGLVARHIPVLNMAISKILGYSHHGSSSLVLATTLANGVAEEVFFRGAVYAAAGEHRRVIQSTALYALVTTATRNPALVLASVVMGTVFGLQRRATGGIQAPILTHLTWSTLMLRYLTPMFPPPSTQRVG